MDQVCIFVIFAEFFLLPLWVGMVTGRGRAPGYILLHSPAPAIALAVPLLILAAVAVKINAEAVLKVQVVAIGFCLLIGAIGALFCSSRRPLAGQYVATIVGWLLLATLFCIDTVLPMTSGGFRSATIGLVTHANPLLAASPLVNFDWTHSSILYRWTSLGEHYRFTSPVWWTTFLAYLACTAVLALLAMLVNRRRR